MPRSTQAAATSCESGDRDGYPAEGGRGGRRRGAGPRGGLNHRAGLRGRRVPVRRIGSERSVLSPALPGTIVDVELANMGGSRMMGGGGMMGGTMRVVASRQDVNAGTVSLRVANVGSLVHELVVLPLASGEQVGSRSVGNDAKVSEAGSLGEASKTCGPGAGDGIDPGALGWVTLNLPRGDYELVCNLPGHYGSGMYTELAVN